MGRGAWWAAVHGIMKSRTQLSNFTFTFHFHALEKEMAAHSSVLAWRIPGTAEPDGLTSMGSLRVGHDWSDLAAAAAAISFPLWKQVWSLCYQNWEIKHGQGLYSQGFLSSGRNIWPQMTACGVTGSLWKETSFCMEVRGKWSGYSTPQCG